MPFVSVLTNPTTGGVYASFATQGDIILAEPGALIGFAGPRVVEQTTGERLPPGSHTAEFLLEHGQIDAVVDRPRLRGTLATLLDAVRRRPRARAGRGTSRRARRRRRPSAWATVQLARRRRPADDGSTTCAS